MLSFPNLEPGLVLAVNQAVNKTDWPGVTYIQLPLIALLDYLKLGGFPCV